MSFTAGNIAISSLMRAEQLTCIPLETPRQLTGTNFLPKLEDVKFKERPNPPLPV